MISDARIVINRCQSTLCRHAMILIPGQPEAITVTETGSQTCQHQFDPAYAVSLRRDALALHGIWTAGRALHSVSDAYRQSIDVTAHILADRLGFEPGEPVPVTEIPLQLVDVDRRELTWPGVRAAWRVAVAMSQSPTGTGARRALWSEVAGYLNVGSMRVL